MKKRHFDVESDGFYGAYWKCKTDSDCAMIAMIGDDSEDYLARTSVKWLHKLGVNVMTMSPAKKTVVRNGQLRENHFSLTKENRFRICRFVINIQTTGM